MATITRSLPALGIYTPAEKRARQERHNAWLREVHQQRARVTFTCDVCGLEARGTSPLWCCTDADVARCTRCCE